MAGCQTRAEFLIRAMHLGIAPEQLGAICRQHSSGLGIGPWASITETMQDEVIGDILDRVEMLDHVGLTLIDGARLTELEHAERTLRTLADLAVERMAQSF